MTRTEVAAVTILVLLLCCLVGPIVGFVVEIPFWLAFGWIAFLMGVAPRVRIDVVHCGLAVGLTVVFVVAAHKFLRWFADTVRESRPGEGTSPGPTWKWRWTVSLTGVILLLFVAGISMTGIVHQAVWIATASEPFLTGGEEMGYRMRDTNNLKQISLGVHHYANERDLLPAGATMDNDGRLLHGWQTQILPFIEQNAVHDRIDLTQPWNADDNRPVMQAEIPSYLLTRPGHRVLPGGVDVAPPGYATTSYAANVHVIGGTTPMRLSEISDGAGQTLLAGSIVEDCPAWGYPRNWRDPAEGLNTSPRGFGSQFRSGTVQFSQVDGSVRSFGPKTDPKILRALATPRGGEKIDPDEVH